MLAVPRFSLAAFMVVLFAARNTIAVCQPGQMAVGQEVITEFTGPAHTFEVYSGFLMANNCGLISQNGNTQAENQMCRGGYFNGANVICDSDNNAIGAVDTQGQQWTCSPRAEDDTNCDEDSGFGGFEVTACCDRS